MSIGSIYGVKINKPKKLSNTVTRKRTPDIKIKSFKDKNKKKHKFTKRSSSHSKLLRRKKLHGGKISSRRKRINNKHTKSRKISFKCYPQNKSKNIDNIIKKANKLSNNSLKEELLKKGIEIKSNKKNLLKDIYMFSAMGGIKIHKE